MRVIRKGEVVRTIPDEEVETAAQIFALDLEPGDILEDDAFPDSVLVKMENGSLVIQRVKRPEDQ